MQALIDLKNGIRRCLLMDIMGHKHVSLWRRSRYIAVRLMTGHLLTRGINPNPIPVPIRFGPIRDLAMLNQNPFLSTQRRRGMWETELVNILHREVPRCNTLIDVGSHDGFYALVFAKLNKIARIIACEPDERLNHLIMQNFALNHLEQGVEKRMEIFNRYLGQPESFPDSEKAKVVTLDEVLSEVSDPVLIKIDIDGGEADCIISGKRTAREKRCIFVVETHSAELENQCLSLLREIEYHCQVIKNVWWRLFFPEERPAGHNRWFIAKNFE